MAIDNEIPTHLNMRIDPKLRYFAELAARARGITLTQYIEDAIAESLKRVSADEFPELNEEPHIYELSDAERREKFKKRQVTVTHPISEIMDRLWSEHPFVRTQLLAVAGYGRLMSEEQKQVWNYLRDSNECKTKDGRLDPKLISQQWPSIRKKALKAANAKGSK